MKLFFVIRITFYPAFLHKGIQVKYIMKNLYFENKRHDLISHLAYSSFYKEITSFPRHIQIFIEGNFLTLLEHMTKET